jgi:hypothetical protein
MLRFCATDGIAAVISIEQTDEAHERVAPGVRYRLVIDTASRKQS